MSFARKHDTSARRRSQPRRTGPVLTTSAPEGQQKSGTHISERLYNENGDQLRRRLGNRQLQMLVIGGSIGTALFVSIGSGLAAGGPASLLLAYAIYSCILILINNCAAETTTYMPVTGGFIRLAGAWCDDALEFAAGWNFFLYQALLVPFEITALCEALRYWRDDIPDVAVIVAALLLFSVINLTTIRWYGEISFWLSSGKVILIAMLFSFTFFAMCGANPKTEVLGFKYWSRPGPFNTHYSAGDIGRFEGFLACLWSAAFCIVGPEYCSMAAAETKRPRVYVKAAFNAITWRTGTIFTLSALAIGILVPYTDPHLLNKHSSLAPSSSPYIIAMERLGISGLPTFINILLITSIFSAGNVYFYCASRSLYGMALTGKAPQVLAYCNSQGNPVLCFCVVLGLACLAFLQLSHGSAIVLGWFLDLTTAGGLINYIVMATTYIFFYRACQAQHVDRSLLPYTGWFQPCSAYIGLGALIIIVLCQGYEAFRTPASVGGFFSHYTMVILATLLFTARKIYNSSTRHPNRARATLDWERVVIDSYETTFIDPPVTLWTEILQLVGLRRRPGGNDKRISTTLE